MKKKSNNNNNSATEHIQRKKRERKKNCIKLSAENMQVKQNVCHTNRGIKQSIHIKSFVCFKIMLMLLIQCCLVCMIKKKKNHFINTIHNNT